MAGSASERLKTRRQEVLERWYERAIAEVPSAKNHRKSLTKNSLPRFLDRLAEALDAKTPVSDGKANNVLSIEHGVQRADLGDYSAEQIMMEYRLLEDTIFDVLEEGGQVSRGERRVITATISTAMMDSVRSFISTIENKKREVESEFKLLVDEVKDYAIFMVDPNGIVISWNAGAERIKGFKPHEAIGQHYRLLYRREDADDKRPERNMEYALRDGRHEEQWWRVRKDGTLFWADATMSVVYDNNGKHIGFSKVVRDLTSKKHADDELQAAKDAAEAANELKTAFLANMSHEIRTPLGAILGFSQMLGEPNLSEQEKRNYLEIIERNGKVLTRLIDDILDTSKVEAGKLEIQYLEVEMRKLLTEVVGIKELKSREKGVPIEMRIHESVPVHVTTDPVRFRQIVTNVLGNAVKFTEHGRIHIEVTYEKRLLRDPQLVLTVTDSGPGIPPHQREKLFKPFAQADGSSTRKYGGTGLGLALSRRLARELGGDVAIIDCPVGDGCTFEIKIEDRKRAETVIPKEAPMESDREPRSSDFLGKKILLVEDSRDNQILVKRLLAKEGASIEVASDGAEAVSKAESSAFHLVLMDIQMPVLDGLSATKKLRAQGFDRPIIALTAHAMQEQRAECLQAGCNDHLTKPIDKNQLIAKISKFLTDVAAKA